MAVSGGAGSPSCLEHSAEGAGGEGQSQGAVRPEVQAEAGPQRALDAVVERLDFYPGQWGSPKGFTLEGDQITWTGFVD